MVEIAGQPQLLSPAADWLYGYDPASGRELWKLPYEMLGFSIVPRPVAGHGLLFMSTSYSQPQLLAVKLEARRKSPGGSPARRRRFPRRCWSATSCT